MIRRYVFNFIFCILALAIATRADAPATQPSGLDTLSDEPLLNLLAERGLDDLLDRAFDQDHVPDDRRAGIRTLASIQRLADDTHLTESQRQAILDTIVSGVDRILLAAGDDPATLIKQARLIAEQGVEPSVDNLEYWGDSPTERSRLRPLAQAVVKMYDQAGKTATAQAAALSDRITSPDDKLAVQWQQASDLAAAAEYQKARMQYALALSLDPNDPLRQTVIDQAEKSLARWDSPDSGIQPLVRLLILKLRVLTGDRDEIADARKVLAALIKNADGSIQPAPTTAQTFAERCFAVLASLAANDATGAKTELAAATKYQKANFPGDRSQESVLRLLAYRLLASQADQLPPGAGKDTANSAAVAALGKLIQDFPESRNLIFRQLASRLPPNPDPATLDPMLLLALVDQGRQQVAAGEAGQKPDAATLQRALAAAREVLARSAAGKVPRGQTIEPSLLIGFFLQYTGDKPGAVEALLDHASRFKNDPAASAAVALDRAQDLLNQLRTAAPDDPQVRRLLARFLPIAIGPPFNREQFALQYAAILFTQEKWAQAVDYYRKVPATEPPGRQLTARFGEMVALKNLLEETQSLTPEQKQQWTKQIQDMAKSVTDLANKLIASPAPDADKLQARSKLAQMSLIAADITRREENDPHRVLDLLNGFENSVQGLPDARSLLNGALFLRVQAYMQLGRNDDATKALVEYLNVADAAAGAQTVRDLLATLNHDLDKARATADAATASHDSAALETANVTIRQLAANRAMLSGFLVKWADQSPDPKIHGNAYLYRRFDADTQLLAARLQTDPAARQKALSGASALYKELESPDNVRLYQATLDPTAVDPNYPDPLVTLGIGLCAYELQDYKTVKATLGALVRDEKLGQDNDQYWEATYKLLDSMQHLVESNDPDTKESEIQQSLKVLYLIWREETGGPKWHDAFEQLRKQVLPNWTIPSNNPAPAAH